MNVALLFPRFKYPSGDPPLGILHVAAAARDAGFSFDWLDTSFDPDWGRLRTRLAEGRYDLLGMYCMTSMLRDVERVTTILEEVSPRTRVILGGPHPTVMPRHALEIPGVDAVCVGEGEETFVELLRNDLDFDGVAGIQYRRGDELVANDPRPPVADLDALPFPALDLLDPRYFSQWFGMDFVREGLRATSVICSRGCPYGCTYCQPTLSTLFGKRIRRMSAARVIELLRWLVDDFGLDGFGFVDDTLLFDRAWVKEICDLLIEADLDLVWTCNSRANLVEREVFSHMRRAGLRKVFMGIESGSQRILDEVYDKRISLAQIHNAAMLLKELDICCQGYFMMGAPTETEEEVRSTIDLAVGLPIDEATFAITTPLPHTHLYDRTSERIDAALADFDYYSKPVYQEGVTLPAERLVKLKREAFLRFYLAPRRLYNTVTSFLSPDGFRKNWNKLKRF